MRLSPRKIESLADAIYQSLQANPELTVDGEPAAVKLLIRQVIVEDLKQEEAIEAEARKLLEAHMTEIQMRGGSMDTLLRRTMQKLARDRKFVL